MLRLIVQVAAQVVQFAPQPFRIILKLLPLVFQAGQRQLVEIGLFLPLGEPLLGQFAHPLPGEDVGFGFFLRQTDPLLR